MDPSNLFVSVDYVEGYDKAANATGHLQGQANIEGKNLVLSLDCKSCHKEGEKSVGPAYRQVAQKYSKDKNARDYLVQKIIKGGSGVWGEVAMPSHPTISGGDVQQIVSWILSLDNKEALKTSLPASGNITPPAAQKPGSVLVLSASYTDKGGNNTKALTGANSLTLRSNTLLFTGKEKVNGFTTYKAGGATVLVLPESQGWFAVDSIDMSGVRSVNLSTGWQVAPETGFGFEVRLDSPDGKIIGKGSMPAPKKDQKAGLIKVPLQAVIDGRFHTLYFNYKAIQPVKAGIASLQFTAD
jgi:cytochrome c551/c552